MSTRALGWFCLVVGVWCFAGCDDTPAEDKNEDVLGDISQVDIPLEDLKEISERQCGTEACEEGQVCCDFECVDLETDTEHCGACGNVCANQMLCVEGLCDCGGRLCESHETCCEDSNGVPRCASLDFDEEHCGACGQICSQDELCYGTVCVCEGANGITEQCAARENCCNGEGCVDFQTDAQNCGGCGLECGAGEQCQEGLCVCGDTVSAAGAAACAPGEACCGSTPTCMPETDPQCQCGTTRCTAGEGCCESEDTEGNPIDACFGLEDNRDHCGACGVACAFGEECRGGRCVCEEGLGDCDNDASNGCESDFSSNGEHCGGCGAGCAAGEVCDGTGVCQVTCQEGLTNCDGSCVNLDSRHAHCGACGVACGPGEVCSEGACATDCQVGLTNCSGDCIDLESDLAHCGFCGHLCDPGKVCSRGLCATSCQEGLTACNDSCVNTRVDRRNCGACGVVCGDGEVCSNGACSIECQPGLTQCGRRCLDLDRDPASCGACGISCNFDESCADGVCELFCGELEACNGRCVDLNVDAQNCSACGNVCPDGEFCVGGVCELFCPTGLTKCDNACVDILIDRNHCGGCGSLCGDGYLCEGGECKLNCPTGEIDCNGQCKNIESDPINCGACDVTCGNQQSCNAGACECTTDWADCNGDPLDGCEANLLISAAHCGTCGTACGATQSCISGVCTCEGNYEDCNGDPADGCEIFILGHPDHCGACGQACADNQLCLAGSCACAGGWGDCNTDGSDGCEVDLRATDEHCGACGNVCHFDLSCEDSACKGDPDLLLRMRFDEGSGTTTFDSSGNGLEGTLTEDMWTSDGIANGAAHFEGGDWITTPYDRNVHDVPEDFTFSLWINNQQPGVWQRIISTVDIWGYGLIINQYNRVQLYPCADSATTIPGNRWVHLAVRYDNTARTATYFIDGEPAETVSNCNFSTTSYWNTIDIGAYNINDSSRFQGFLDELKIWKTQRTDEQILDEASVLALHLDEGADLEAFDTSDLRNFGLLSGGATWTSGSVGGAVAFDGVDAAITVQDDDTLDLTDNFTLEIEVQRDTSALGEAVLIAKDDGSTAGGWELAFDAQDQLIFSIRGSGIVAQGTTPLQDNAWHSIEVRRVGEFVILSIDGVIDASASTLVPITDTAAPLSLGYDTSGSAHFTGALDEIRIRPRAPRNSDLLVSYRFDEGSGTTSLDVANGEHHLALAGAATWTDGVAGQALYLDGSDGSAGSTGLTLDGMPPRWTVSAWVYDEKGPGTNRDVVLFRGSASWGLYINSSDQLGFVSCTPLGRVDSNRWTHLAAVYDGSGVRYYIDGRDVGRVTCNPGSSWSRMWIGSYGSADTWRFTGAIDEVRVYRSDFDAAGIAQLASAAALPMDAGQNSRLEDASTLLNRGTITGAAWTSGITGAGLDFDGSGDIVTLDNRGSFDINDSRLEIGLDFKRGTSGVDETLVARADSSSGWRLHFTDDDLLALSTHDQEIFTSQTAITDSDWHHVDVYRAGETYILYIDGSPDAQTLSKSAPTPSTAPVTAGDTDAGGTPFTGTLDNLRVGSFLPPDPTHRFIYHFDEGTGTTSADTSGYDWTVTLRNGTTFDEGISGSALRFDGADDWTSSAHPNRINWPTRWTIAAWVYDEKGSGLRRHIMQFNGNSGFYIETNDLLTFSPCGSSTGVVPTGRWTHVAATYDGATIRYYIDGEPAGSRACNATSQPAYIRPGAYASNDTYRFRGRIDELLFEHSNRDDAGMAELASVLTWNFDEGRGTVAQDASPILNRGGISGATWTPGTSGGALAFDGSGDIVTAASRDALDLDGNFSLSLSVKRGGSNGTRQTLIAKDDGSTSGGWSVALDSANRLVFHVRGLGDLIQSTQPITDTAWHDLLIERSGELYHITIDGADAGEVIELRGPSATSVEITAGALSGGGESWTGSLDSIQITPVAAQGSSDLRLRLRFDEGSGTVAADTSGNSYDGTLIAGPTWERGVAGNAVRFDGADDYINTAYAGSTGRPSTFTIMFWMYDDKVYGFNRYPLNVSTSTNGVYINTSERIGFSGCTTGGYVPKNRWTHLALAYDGTTMRYYVDGRPAGSAVCNPGAWTDIRIGSTTTATDSNRFKGLIDEVNIFERHLSDAEVADAASLISFHFDEGAGSATRDSSGLNRIGTLSGATWTATNDGQGLAFDGVDDVVTVPHQPELNLDLQNFTIRLNVRRDSGLGANAILAAKDDGSTAGGWRLMFNSSNRPVFWIRGVGEIVAGSPITDSTWHTLELERYGERYALRVDGADADTAFADAEPSGSSGALTLGDSAAGGAPFQGDLDELQITIVRPASIEHFFTLRLNEDTGTSSDDVSGNQHHATFNGATWDTGVSGSSARLDGSNDNITTTFNANFPNPSTWSIGAWIYDEKGPGTTRDIVALYSSSTFYINTANQLDIPGCSAAGSQVRSYRWTHVGVTFDGTTARYYIDGQLAGTTNCNATVINNFDLGSHTTGSDSGRFQGRIDEVRAFNRQLSDTEMASLGRLFSFDFEEGYGPTLVDRSTLRHDGAISGAVWGTGNPGSALTFDGSNDRVTVPSQPVFNFTDNHFTLSIDFKRAGSLGSAATLLSKSDGSTAGGWSLILNDFNRLAFVIDGVGQVAVGATTITDTNWHTARVERSGDYITLLLDDAIDGQGVTAEATVATSINLVIGDNAAGSAPFSGALDNAFAHPTIPGKPLLRMAYTFDSSSNTTLFDRSGNGFDGNLLNGPTRVPGISGNALSFDGISTAGDWVNIIAPNTLGTPDDYAISAWIYSEKSTGTTRRILQISSSSGLYIDSGEHLRFAGCGAATDLPVPSNTWAHVVARYDGIQMRYYVNGRLAGTATCSPTAWSSYSLAGYTNSGDGSRFQGKMDEVYFFEDMLSDEAIDDLSTLVSLRFDEGAGTQAVDSSTFLNHASLSGTTWGAGASGSALVFDGSASTVATVADTEEFDLGERFTLQASVKRTRTGAREVLIARDNGSTAGRWSFYINASDQLAFSLDGTEIVTSGTTLLDDTAWHDAMIVRSGESYTLYIDDVEVGVNYSLPISVPAANALPITVGSDGTNTLNGSIDNVQLRPYAYYQPTLFARFHFDENAGSLSEDTSGNDFDANVPNPTTQWTSGHSGSGLSFASGADMVTSRYTTAFTSPEKWTFEAWVYDTRGTNTRRIFNFNGSSALYIQNSSNAMVWSGCAVSNTAIPANTWTHIAVTYDGLNATYYVNGNPAGSPACNLTGWSRMYFGAYYTGDTGNFGGIIDEVLIYREVRTQAQIIADRDGT